VLSKITVPSIRLYTPSILAIVSVENYAAVPGKERAI
jgi:hypothetical protein